MQTRAVTFENLVGNCGGYVGLFVGYSIFQLPDILLSFYSWAIFYFKKKWFVWLFRNESCKIISLKSRKGQSRRPLNCIDSKDEEIRFNEGKSEESQEDEDIKNIVKSLFKLIRENKKAIDELRHKVEGK